MKLGWHIANRAGYEVVHLGGARLLELNWRLALGLIWRQSGGLWEQTRMKGVVCRVGGAPGLIYSRESRAPVMGASQHTACASLRGFELHNARAPSGLPLCHSYRGRRANRAHCRTGRIRHQPSRGVLGGVWEENCSGGQTKMTVLGNNFLLSGD